MKLFYSIILSILISTLFSQESKDHIIKLNKDTVFTKVIKIDGSLEVVVCEEKEKKIKYKAKDILEVKTDTVFYESGLVRLKKLKSKHYVFLQRTLKGNLSLYGINVKRSKFSWKTFGEDLVHFRWVYRAHDWFKRDLITINFYKKKNETRENFSKYWKEKTKGCNLLNDKFNSKVTPWASTPMEIVQFYNASCK